jgi:hypothetical protein
MTEDLTTEQPIAEDLTSEQPAAADPTTEQPTAEDLLTRIKRETDERLELLRAAVAESKRLRADLRTLDAQPEMHLEEDEEADEDEDEDKDEDETGMDDPERSAQILRFPVRRRPPRTPLVSPKVARLMSSRGSLQLERPGPGAGKKKVRVASSSADAPAAGAQGW